MQLQDLERMNTEDGPPASSQPLFLRRMFQSISSRYDVLNRVLTFGMDHRWRRKAAMSCIGAPGQVILDLCCGTG
ncbi:MAG: class I SAM-dependent methyltransferase, partial [Thermoplasmata archaeon]